MKNKAFLDAQSASEEGDRVGHEGFPPVNSDMAERHKTERHVHTLLGLLESVSHRFPGALSPHAQSICASIAREVGSVAFSRLTSNQK